MATIFPYTPRKASYDTLASTLVARGAFLDELISNLRKQAEVETLQHWMILGTRGMGKSHIITMIYYMVKQDDFLNKKWIPILMNEEEQGVFSLHTLFTRILTKLGEEIARSEKPKGEAIKEILDSLRDREWTQDEILETVISYLKDFASASKKRFLVLLENSDDLFTKSLPKQNDIKKFRKLLQHENFLLLLATSPTFFGRISSSKAPLYQFFRLRRLDLLDYDEAVELLNKWATLDKESNGKEKHIVEFKKNDYRLRVLYHLTGGNPRILLFLYMAISGQGGIETAVDTFSRLLEEDLSNYYLSRMRDLSNQVQPIVIALAESDHNLAQTEIARKTFLPTKSIGTAMVRLEDDGIVRPVSDKKGKNTLYTLTDHLFRLWHQWRTSLRERKVIEAIVEFLSIWYKKKELEAWTGVGGLTGVYCKEAIDFRNTRKFRSYWERLYTEGKDYVNEFLAQKDYHSLFETLEFFKECGLDTVALTTIAISGIEKNGGFREADQYFRTKLESDPKNLEGYLILGRILIRKGDYHGAEVIFERALKINSQDAASWGNIAHARFHQDNFAGVEDAWKHAVELDPKDAIAWGGLGTARALLSNYIGAEEALTQAVDLDPKSVMDWIKLGITRQLLVNFVGAEEALMQAVDLDPKNIMAWKKLGDIRIKQKNYLGAEKAYRNAVNLKSGDAKIWEDLGHALFHQKNFTAVKEAFGKAVQLDPNQTMAWLFLGIAHFQMKDYARAEEALRRAVELDPKEAPTWMNLGGARFHQGNYVGAEEASLRAVELDPKEAPAWMNLGIARFEQENYRGAEEAFSRAAELDPKEALTWMNLGSARFHQGNYVGAEEASLRAVELDPKEAPAWMNLGATRLLQENYSGAEEALVRAVELDPKKAEPWMMLAVSRYENYKFATAAENLIMGISLDRKDLSGYSDLCELYLRNNLAIEPKGVLEKALSIEDTSDGFKSYILFLRAMIYLHGQDRIPFLGDLQEGINQLENLEEESRRRLLGRLIDFLVDIMYPDILEEIRTYTESLRQFSPKLASVLDPLHYVLDYFKEYTSAEKKNGTSAIRAQRILDNVPLELRGPVEEMVQKVHKNIIWWERRPR